MKDFLGNTLSVGDEVIHISMANTNARLRKGIITKIYDNDEECSVDSMPHIQSKRIMKVQNQTEGD